MAIEAFKVGAEFLMIVHGDFDGHNAPHAHEELQRVIDDGVTQLTIDLSDATAIDEGAMAVLGAAVSQAKSRGCLVFVIPAHGRVVEIHDLSLLRSVFED